MKKRLWSILLTACLALSLCTGLSGTLLAKAAGESSIHINDLVQVKVGDSLTDLNVYRNGVYEAMVPVEAGTHTATVLINGVETDMTTTFTADTTGTVCLRVMDNTLTKVSIQSCTLVGDFDESFFEDEGGQSFRIEWRLPHPNAELEYLGGGLYGRTFQFQKLSKDHKHEYKVAFNDSWDDCFGDGGAPIILIIPAGSSSFTILVDEINRVVYDSIRSGSFSVAQDSGAIALPALATTVSLIGTARGDEAVNGDVNAKGYEFDLISNTLYRYQKTFEAGVYDYRCVFDYDFQYAQDRSFTLTEKTHVVFLYDTVTGRLYDTVNDYSAVAELIGVQAPPAQTKISAMYLDENGHEQTALCDAAITASNLPAALGEAGETTWYVVQGDVTIGTDMNPQRVTVSGDVHLILADGCNFTVYGGIQVEDNDDDPNNGSPNALTIYAQSVPVLDENGIVNETENTAGKLTVRDVVGQDAAIGGNGGDEVTITGGSGGTITINGGIVQTRGSTDGAGIGGGGGGTNGAGIGGSGGSGGTITITGGSVVVSSHTGAGIGGGCGRGGIDSAGSGGNIIITGGRVNAQSNGLGANIGGGGIGDGRIGDGGTLIITGGTITFVDSVTGLPKGYNGSAYIIPDGNSSLKAVGTLTLPVDLTIPRDKTLTIGEGQTLTIPEGVTLTIEDGGTLTNNGTIINLGTIIGTVSVNQPKIYAKYLDENGEKQTVLCDAAITASNIGSYGTLNAGWYVVKGTVTASSRIEVSGAVHLILADGCDFTVNGGIRVEDYDRDPDTPSPNALTICAQSTDESTMGKLTANGRAVFNRAGIGGGFGSNITINGGIVTAIGGEGGAGIGGGFSDRGSNITISGGMVKATGNNAAGIGGGTGGIGSNITISGGTVTAIGNDGGAGIGGGYGDRGIGSYITISGGTVIATGGSTLVGVGGAGIGGGGFGSGSNIIISGGTVIATGNEGGAGIGGGDAVGRGGARGNGSNITISGGTVTATGNEGGAGIGGGTFGDGRNITISGGTVTATNTGGGVGIGGGDGGDSDTFRTNDGKAVLFASSIGDNTDKTAWSGVIFEGNDGKVYGTTITPIEDFTIDSDKNLLIPEIAKLTTTGITAVNNGSVYVDGSLSGMVDGNGSVYYPLTVKGGTASGDVSTYQSKNYGKAGSEITLTPDTPPRGYAFSAWEVSSADAVTVADDTFTMPGAAVKVEAKWTKNSSGGSFAPTYAPTVTQPENGTVTVSPKSPRKGDTVTITPRPEAGYTVETITVTDENGKSVPVKDNGDGTFSFTQPAGKVNVEVTFMEDNSMLNFFVDVPAGAYYYDAVLWAAENGITGGVDDTHFAPNAPCTRVQIVTFLWRAAKCPEPETMTSFADVPADSYYAKAVAWALENGITTGTRDGTTFSPNATCTRAQAMAFIYRSEQARGGGMQGAWMFLNPFADVNLESYYGEAVMWAVANGVTDGTTATTFSPNANCTRAQIVTFLFRCLGE